MHCGGVPHFGAGAEVPYLVASVGVSLVVAGAAILFNCLQVYLLYMLPWAAFCAPLL